MVHSLPTQISTPANPHFMRAMGWRCGITKGGFRVMENPQNKSTYVGYRFFEQSTWLSSQFNPVGANKKAFAILLC